MKIFLKISYWRSTIQNSLYDSRLEQQNQNFDSEYNNIRKIGPHGA